MRYLIALLAVLSLNNAKSNQQGGVQPCSIACFEIIDQLFGRKEVRKPLLSESEKSVGVSMLTLKKWLEEVNYEVSGFKGDVSDLVDPKAVYLLHLKTDHYVCVRSTSQGFVIYDPLSIPVKLESLRSISGWDGYGLMVKCGHRDPESNLALNTNKIDFGMVGVNEPAETEIKVFNLSKSDVWIAHVRTSCSCLAPIVKECHIKPKGNTDIVFKFGGRSEDSIVKQQALIEARTENGTEAIMVPMRAEVVSQSGLYPHLINLGAFNSVANRTVRITNPKFRDVSKISFKIKWIQGSANINVAAIKIGDVIQITFTPEQRVAQKGSDMLFELVSGVLSFADSKSGVNIGSIPVQLRR
jgi:hypothetical protein